MAGEVFLLEHTREHEDGSMDVKTIGIYSTREKALETAQRLRARPGFSDIPEGFTIDLYLLDQASWEEGFFTPRQHG